MDEETEETKPVVEMENVTLDLEDDELELVIEALALLIQDENTRAGKKFDASDLLAKFGYGPDGRRSE